MPRIPTYEQQTSPNASQLPTEMPAYGQATARAVGQAGAAVGKLADVAIGWEEAKAKVVADEAASQYQFDALTSLIAAESDYKVEDDPSEMVNKFRGALTESRQKLIEQNTDKPFVKKALADRLNSIDERLTVRAMTTQAEAQGKHIAFKIGKTLDNYAKMAIQDPSSFLEYETQAHAAMDRIGGEYSGADKKAEWSAKVAAHILSANLQADPVGVEEMLKDKEDPLTKALTAEQYGKLQQDAHKGAVEVKGNEQGDAIGAQAFAAQGDGGLDVIKQRVESIRKTDPEMADIVERSAYQSFAREQRIYAGNVKAEHDNMIALTASGKAWVAPGWMQPGDVIELGDKRKRMQYNMASDAEGFARQSDEAYLTEVMNAAFSQDKTAFNEMLLDKTRLSRTHYNSYLQMQGKTRSDRTATEGDIGPAVDRYLASHQFTGTNDQKKARIAATKTIMLDLVMAAEAKKQGGKMTRNEMDTMFAKAFEQSGEAVSAIPFMSASHPAIDMINPEMGTLISGAIVKAGGMPYPDAVLKVQQDIERQQDSIEDAIENASLPVTPANIVRYYIETYQNRGTK